METYAQIGNLMNLIFCWRNKALIGVKMNTIHAVDIKIIKLIGN